MAKYTTEIRSIVESGKPIFDFDYPIFDEAYRGVLEQKIIDYYYFREIGLETVGQFKHFLKSKMNRIMPYYNQLYDTEGLVTRDTYNINLDNTITKTNDIDTTTTSTSVGHSDVVGNVTENSDSTTTDNGDNESIFSDTPQAKLNDLDYATNLTKDSHGNTVVVDGGAISDSTNTVDDNVTTDGSLRTIESYTEHLLGNGSMRYNADILMEWRKSFLNIDQQIIDEMHDLFMNIH